MASSDAGRHITDESFLFVKSTLQQQEIAWILDGYYFIIQIGWE